MIDEAVALIGRLKAANQDLARQLAESERCRKTAARRLDVLVDRVEQMSDRCATPAVTAPGTEVAARSRRAGGLARGRRKSKSTGSRVDSPGTRNVTPGADGNLQS